MGDALPYVITIGIIAIAVAIGIIIGRKNNKKFEQGIAKKRNYDFYTQSNTFKTVVPDLATFLTALDRHTLQAEGVYMTQDAANDRLIFRNAQNTMTATLSSIGEGGDGIHLFLFKVNNWKERNGSIELSARMASNIALTAVEKAFLTLDFNAVVERVYMTGLKTKSSLL